VAPEDDLIARLQSLAAEPVADEVAAHHFSLMDGAAPAAPRRRMRSMVAGGTLVAAMLAGTGIAAAAGNLPNPAQDAAHTVLSKVGVDVPRGTARSTDGCDGKTYANHGQFVRSQPKGAARDAAAKSNCGKPVASTDNTDKTDSGDKADDQTSPTAKGQTPNTDKGPNGQDNGASNPNKPANPGKSTTAREAKKAAHKP
jgi:hypothetical protein